MRRRQLAPELPCSSSRIVLSGFLTAAFVSFTVASAAKISVVSAHETPALCCSSGCPQCLQTLSFFDLPSYDLTVILGDLGDLGDLPLLFSPRSSWLVLRICSRLVLRADAYSDV